MVEAIPINLDCGCGQPETAPEANPWRLPFALAVSTCRRPEPCMQCRIELPPRHLARGQIRSGQIDIRQIGAGQIGERQIGTCKPHTAQVRLAQIDVAEARA